METLAGEGVAQDFSALHLSPAQPLLSTCPARPSRAPPVFPCFCADTATASSLCSLSRGRVPPYPLPPPFQEQLLNCPSAPSPSHQLHLAPRAATLPLSSLNPHFQTLSAGLTGSTAGDSGRFPPPRAWPPPSRHGSSPCCAPGPASRPASGSREFPPHRGGLRALLTRHAAQRCSVPPWPPGSAPQEGPPLTAHSSRLRDRP